MMTVGEFEAKTKDLDDRLLAVGFDREWGAIFGYMLGRLGAKMGWEKLDAFLIDFLAVMKVVHGQLKS